VKPLDIAGYSIPSDPQLHPAGSSGVYVVTRANLDEDRYDSSIWLWDGDAERPFTHGPVDSRPRWSPDGTRLAFLRGSHEDGVSAQLAIARVDGGEAEVITDFSLGVKEAEWSPDGTHLVITVTEWAQEWEDVDPEERARRPRRITGPEWRFDGAGFLHDKVTSLCSVTPDGSVVQRLTAVGRPSGAVWRPDGGAVGFVAATHTTAGFDGAGQAWEVDLEGSEPRALTEVGGWDAVAYRPDGAVFVLGLVDLAAGPGSSSMFQIVDGQPEMLVPELDRDVVWPSPGPVWCDDGSGLVLAEDRGRQIVVRISESGSHEVVMGSDCLVTGLSADPSGSTLFVTTTSVTDPGETSVVVNGEVLWSSSINEDFRVSTTLSEAQHIIVKRDDLDLDVWVYMPEGAGPFPTLFNIHGGPMAQYGWGFFDEFQVETGAGFAVVVTNPRGASGRGDTFMKGEVGTWHLDQPPDALDLLAALDGALDTFPQLDRSRLGIMGGSYGGLISSKILSFDHRFKSAIPERGLYNFVSFAGTSDIGLYFDSMFVGPRDYADWVPLWNASPLRTAHQIRTPCLVIHSEADHRCPIEQGEQFYATLIANGVEAEFLRFPGEGHELSRSGKPRHRVERFDAVIDWHNRYLTD
jgi:dipeptidyl aminopeptidase/acylaminoacyl peptidase